MSIRPEPTFPPQGVFRQSDGRLLWRVWAPFSEHVSLVTWPRGERTEIPMTAVGNGYFEEESGEPFSGGALPRAPAKGRPLNGLSTLHYAYKLSNGPDRPDPASRWQPDGVHRPSAVFFPEDYAWTDQSWQGIPRDELVIYELHVGTFTPEGTFEAVIPRLAQLAELGITAIELMPVAQFPGERNWGYDGVHPFAVQNSYGGPQGLQRLVEAAHQAGLAVFLDVVYNHLGPEGNYLHEFGPYFTDRYHTPWGSAVNYDGPDCDPVRQYVCDNACMWVRDFHIDGLRLDAVHAIYDFSAHHILAQLQESVQAEADRAGRPVHVVAETHQNDVRLIRSPERGGYGLDGVWSDDFHHSVHALITGERDGYYEDFGEPEDLVKAFNRVYVYDGCYSRFRRRRHGNRVGAMDRTHFVVCIKNHDQVGNRAQGDRFATLLPPEAFRLATGLLLLSPCVPMIFMGDEYSETRPFPFFCSFGDPELNDAVRRGRRQEFAELKFEWGEEIPDPPNEATFHSAKLSWAWPEDSAQAGMRRLHGDLLRARREWSALCDRENTTARLVRDGGVFDDAPPKPTARLGNRPQAVGLGDAGPSGIQNAVLLLERGTGEQRLVACANLTPTPQPVPPLELDGQDLILRTADERYTGGKRSEEGSDRLEPYELMIFGPGDWRL